MVEYLIKNAQIIDGSGTESFFGDVAVAEGRIAAVGRLPHLEAGRTIDAAGRTLTPGFVDIHRHGDAALFRPDYGKAELMQGITTVLGGNCGLSAAPAEGPHAAEIAAYNSPITGPLSGRCFPAVADYFAQALAVPARINTGLLVGMGTLRANVAGFDSAPLSSEQLGRLHTLLNTALADGAMGASLGLGYAPECFYTTEELICALEPLRSSGTVVTVHMRQEGDGVVSALREMVSVARALQTPVEISHLKAIGRRNWGRAVPEMLRILADARQEGLDITCDVYPYPAGSTQLLHVLPPECQIGGTAALTARLGDPTERAAIRRRMETGTDFENITALVGFENVLATGLRLPRHAAFEGKSLSDIAAAQRKDPYDALFDLLAAEECAVSMIDFIAAEADIEAILRCDHSCVISDATYPTAGLVHPRVYGMTARLLEEYVFKRGILTLPQAVNRLTQRPADRFGLSRKGRIRVGADADLCLFDPRRIHETATYAKPRQYAQGMDYVFVGGVPAVADGAFTDRFGGRPLKRCVREQSTAHPKQEEREV